MPYDPPPELAALSLAEVAALVAERRLPPVDAWQPTNTGDSLMRIAADGRWFHDGGEIVKPAMIRAFGSILVRANDGRHWLMTPTQKLVVAVEDAAFIATDVREDGGDIAFRLNTDELLIAGPDHPIRVAGDTDTPAIYVAVRHGTEARLNRSTYAQLIDIAIGELDELRDDLAVTSAGVRFALRPR